MIGKNICVWRNVRGLSQEDVAVAAGISLLAIQFYEEEKWRPGTPVISRLAEVLQVKIADLVGNCKEVYDDNGDLILVEKDCGCHVVVLGKFKNKTT